MADEKIVNHDNVDQIIGELIEFPFWPEGIEPRVRYRVQTDDTDADPAYGWLSLVFSIDGDAHLSGTARNGLPDEIRFRTFGGGGSHLGVRNACLILAVAMKRDMEGQR